MSTTGQPRKPTVGSFGVGCGRRIASQRSLRGWKQNELAARLDVSPNIVSRWESGVLPTAERLIQLADLFGVTESWLLRGDASEQPAKAA